MRYLSLILIVLAMWWTWSITHSRAEISESEHANVQRELKDVIRNYITSHLPSAKNIQFERFWTETLKPNSIRASFAYTFDDEDTDHTAARIGIEGNAVLNRQVSQTPDAGDVWSLDQLNVTNNHYIFLNGSTVGK